MKKILQTEVGTSDFTNICMICKPYTNGIFWVMCLKMLLLASFPNHARDTVSQQ